MEGRGAAVVGGCEEDSLGANGSMKTRLQSLRTKLRNEGEHGGEHPSFERDLATPQSTRCMYTQSGVVCCIGTFRTETQTRKRLTRVAIDAVGAMKSGETVIWDRLGRSGRAVNPSSQHYSPVARDLFEERGVSIKFLPPKGKYFNPLELLFNDLKQHYIRPNFPKNGRPLSKSKIAGLIRGYVDETAARVLPGFFQARANGKDAVAKRIV